jgi:hypothetical protein
VTRTDTQRSRSWFGNRVDRHSFIYFHIGLTTFDAINDTVVEVRCYAAHFGALTSKEVVSRVVKAQIAFDVE